MSWKRIDGALRQITCKGANAAGCNEGQSIYQRDNNSDTWTNLPGAGVWASAGVDHSVWSCNSAQEIYRWNGNWERVPGACVQIDAWAYDRAIYVNAQQELWEYRDGSSHRLPGTGIHITIGADGEKWHVNSSGAIYRMLPGQDQWQPVPGSLKSIHCTSGDGEYVAGVDAAGNLYRWDGAGWTQLPGSGTYIGITWGTMFQVNSSDEIYQAFI